MAMFDNDSLLQTTFNDSETQQMGSDNNWVNRGIEDIRMPNTYIKIAYVSIAAVGFLGNLIVIIVILKSLTMRKTFTNMLILNQSCVDFITSLLVILTTTTRTPMANLSGITGDVFCKLWLSDLPLWTLLSSSSYALIVLTIERYVAIVHPIFHHNSFSRIKVLLLAGSTWLAGLMVMLCVIVPTSGVIDGRCYVVALFASATWQKVYGVFIFFVLYLIPIIVFITCYSRIVKHLRIRVIPQEQSSGNEATNWKARTRRKVIKMLVIVVVCYVLCNSWSHCTFLAFNFGYPVDFNSGFYNFTVIATFANCCINPIIYALQYETFQKECRKVLFKCGGPAPIATTT